jgi:hypothetical protein
MMAPANDARSAHEDFFEKRLSVLERAQRRVMQRLSFWSRREERFALARLLTAALLVMVLAGFYRRLDASQVFLGWLGFLILFFFLGSIHARLKRIRARCEGVAGVFAAEVLRVSRDWESLRNLRSPERGQLWQNSMQTETEHPYRSDLDLTGIVPLWLDTCTLAEGSATLARELLTRGTEPLSEPDLLARRETVETLAAQSKALRRWESFRMGPWAKELDRVSEKAASTEESPEGADRSPQERERERLFQRSLLEIFLWGFVFAQLTFWFVFVLPALLKFLKTADATVLAQPSTLFFLLLVLGALFWEAWRRKVQMSTGSLGLRELKVLAALEDVARCLPGDKSRRAIVPVSAGRRFRFLRTTFELGEVRRNPIVWLILNILLPFDALSFAVTLLAHRLIDGRFEQWWSDVVAFDFHAALARVKLENPEFVWPKPAEQLICAVQLAHPFLRVSKRVGNDLSLDASQRCLLLTGSNMAGKSTLLRALGMNSLLAQIGTVVCAEEFSIPRVEILCAIQVSDSLETGASYFYAEVRRLVSVLDRLKLPSEGPGQRLFLIDEIFRGTNNRERFLGSWQVISALLSTGAFGLLTTHDLALTSLEQQVSGVRNYHLRETVGEHGKLEFDYLLRPGPCPTTNALVIMKQAGLPVELNFNPVV